PAPAAAPTAEPVYRAREAAPSSAAAPPASVPSTAAPSTAAPSAPAQTPPPAPQQQAAPAPQGGGDVEALRRAWPQILDRLGKIKRSTWALVAPNATVARLDGDAVILSFSTPGLAGAFGRGDHKTHLQTAVKEVLGLDCRVEAVAGDAAAPPPSFQTSRPSAPEEPSTPSPAAGPATAEEPPGWGDSPKAPASQENIPPASGPGRSAPQRTVPSGDFHPLDQPRDEDEPPLDDEPPYDDGPSDWGRPSAPAAPATPASPAPSARQAAGAATADAPAAPAASGGPSGALQDDPWSRAREVSPGRWTVGTESNVSTGNGGSAASAAIPGQGFQEPEFEDEDLADEDLSGSGPAPVPAAEAPAGDPWGLPAEPASTPERTDATGQATTAPAPAAAPASRPTEAPAPGEPGAGNDARDGSQSLYQRLSNSPQAQRAREEARRAAPAQAQNPDGSVAGYAVDEISADDETIEESSTFGRAAVERLLDGTLIEETTLDGTPIIRR
ncbi:MAG: hypothetical protein J7474_01725, partial [Arthrobacter sp.]|nr:hypothetical protein [Arthrobacter sp.]